MLHRLVLGIFFRFFFYIFKNTCAHISCVNVYTRVYTFTHDCVLVLVFYQIVILKISFFKRYFLRLKHVNKTGKKYYFFFSRCVEGATRVRISSRSLHSLSHKYAWKRREHISPLHLGLKKQSRRDPPPQP